MTDFKIPGGTTRLDVLTSSIYFSDLWSAIILLSNESDGEFELDITIDGESNPSISKRFLEQLATVPKKFGRLHCNIYFLLDSPSKDRTIFIWSDNNSPLSALEYHGGFDLKYLDESVAQSAKRREPSQTFDMLINLGSNLISSHNPTCEERVSHTGKDLRDDHLESSKIFEGIEQIINMPLVQVKRNPGQIHVTSGLNWGQRPGRNPNQAYLPVSKEARDINFFPEVGERFQIITDDGYTFEVARAQSSGKAIETPGDNSILGLYFRRRMGVPPGVRISTEDLALYGSNAVKFTKVSQNCYLMEFRPGNMIID